MAETTVLEPDLDFIKAIRAVGGDSVKACYQCATCSTICKLSPEASPFPRKEMHLAQWGLRDRLVRDGDIWLCHDCTDCSDHCPRGARPSDVMAALRQQAVAHYAWPKHLAKLAKTPKGLPLLMAVPAVFFALIFILFGGEDKADPGSIEFATAFPHLPLELLFFAISGFLLFVISRGGIAFWRDITRRHPLPEGTGLGRVIGAFPGTLMEILGHRRFRTCKTEGPRATGHLLMLFGFAALTVVGTVIGIGSMAGLVHTPLDLASPMKIFANVGAIVILIGSVMLLLGRFGRREKINRGTWFDWFLVVLLNVVVATGLLSEITRLANVPALAFGIYVFHLIAVYCLLTYIPFSKLSHMVYRTLAMHHGRLTGRIPPADPLATR